MPKQSVYIETTFVSYLTAWPSRNIVRAADQIMTRDWWDTQRDRFDLFTSELVVVEASAGDANAAAQRVAVLRTLPVVDTSPEAARLATTLIAALAVPASESRDALHIATAAVNGIDYLLTWNCTHLANAELRDKIAETCVGFGVRPPAIVTPRLLFKEAAHEEPE